MPSIINCSNTESNGLSELNEIRNSLASGGLTIVNGICRLPPTATETLTITNTWGASVDQRGKTILQGGAYRNLMGIDIVDSRNVGIYDIEHYPKSYGIRQSGNTITIWIERNYINCTDQAINLDRVAGARVIGNTISNWSGQVGTAVLIGRTELGYEAGLFSGNIIEGFGNSFRMGGSGNLLNMRFDGNYTDRPGYFHYLIEPLSTASARNIVISEPWMNGGLYGVAASVAETTGRIDALDIIGGRALGSLNALSIQGDASRVSYRSIGGIATGPLEPG